MRRYDEWRYRVSDILDANLTRTLMLTLPPAEGSKVKRYHVNFTSDLSDTLAEVKHLAVSLKDFNFKIFSLFKFEVFTHIWFHRSQTSCK